MDAYTVILTRFDLHFKRCDIKQKINIFLQKEV